MNTFTYRQAVKAVIPGHFYCAFDPVTRQIRLTVEASSADEAQQRMASVAPFIGVAKAKVFFFVVLEEAPHGVPTFLKCFFPVPEVTRRIAPSRGQTLHCASRDE